MNGSGNIENYSDLDLLFFVISRLCMKRDNLPRGALSRSLSIAITQLEIAYAYLSVFAKEGASKDD